MLRQEHKYSEYQNLLLNINLCRLMCLYMLSACLQAYTFPFNNSALKLKTYFFSSSAYHQALISTSNQKSTKTFLNEIKLVKSVITLSAASYQLFHLSSCLNRQLPPKFQVTKIIVS